MRKDALTKRKPTALPIAWREAEYAALRLIAADTCDDRVGEDMFDINDDRAEVDSMCHQRLHDAH